MPNLVGTGLNQVPTNSMLGGLAYQSPDHASIKDLDLKNLSQINASTADTAVDVFVYDTSRDSDGGAWRKRTQHTSWYNETLNTATRGSRREFPAVAVIVAESDTITIYDGDDPDLPMWMVFESGSTIIKGSASNRSISALNGILMLGMNGGTSATAVLVECYFVSDELRQRYDNNYDYQNNNISERNETPSKYLATGDVLVSRYVNDVAMTVLPNAPIDSATGLPVPTIAVATDGGVSVIKDDGTVVDLRQNHANANHVDYIDFDSKTNAIIWTTDYQPESAAAQAYKLNVNPVPSGDTVTGNIITGVYQDWNRTIQSGGNSTIPKLQGHPIIEVISAGGDGSYAVATDTGYGGSALNLIKEFPNSPAGSTSNLDAMIAYITSSYNTGWMYREIKGAFLGDTSLVADGPEFVTGGDFSNASDWSLGTNWSINGSGQAVHTSAAGYIQQSTTGGNNFVQGKWYQLTCDVISGSVTGFGIVNHHDTSVAQPHTGNAYSDVYCIQVGSRGMAIWKQNGNNLNTINLYANVAVTVDNVSIKEITEPYYDRSLNSYHLVRFGTINREIISGSELASYAPANSSSYLIRPTSSDANWSNDFYVSFWYYTTGKLSIENTNTSGYNNTILLIAPSTTGFSIRSKVGNWYQTITSPNSGWNQVVGVHNSSEGNLKIYKNGTLLATYSGSPANQSAYYSIFSNTYNGADFPASTNTSARMALVKVSNSAPSAEQIKKIYEDEKVLFQENAKCTLYGSSDTVTALAYDEVTERLHVGTSSGRSEFQGLRRINNTTTAVTTAISAYDSFVVEQ